MVVEEEVAVEVEIKSPANTFHMFLARSQHLSKATRYVQGCDLLEGDWEKAGTIVLWKLVFDGEERFSKDRIETMDFEKNVIQWRVLDGPLKKEYNSLLKTMKASPKKEGLGTVVKWNLKYERIDEKVAHPDKVIQLLVGVTREVDRYILSQDSWDLSA